MEETLRRLFDYQKFIGNPDLQQVIDATHARYTRRQLNPAELEHVSAAGMTADQSGKKKLKPWDIYALPDKE